MSVKVSFYHSNLKYPAYTAPIVGLMLDNFCDAGQTLNQRWVDVLCLLDIGSFNLLLTLLIFSDLKNKNFFLQFSYNFQKHKICEVK